MTRAALATILISVWLRTLAGDDLEPILASLDRNAKGTVELAVASAGDPTVVRYRVLATPQGWAVLAPQGPHEDDDVVWLVTQGYAWHWTPGQLDPARVGRYQPLLARPWRAPVAPYGRILAYRDLPPDRYALAHWLHFAWFGRLAVDPAWMRVAHGGAATTLTADGGGFRRATAASILADRPRDIAAPTRFEWSWTVAPGEPARVEAIAWNTTWDTRATRGAMRVLEWQTPGALVLPKRIEVSRHPVERVRAGDASETEVLVVSVRDGTGLPEPPARPPTGIRFEATSPDAALPLPDGLADIRDLVEFAEDDRADGPSKTRALERIAALPSGASIRRELELSRDDLDDCDVSHYVEAMLAEPVPDANSARWAWSRRDLVRLLLAAARHPSVGQQLRVHAPFSALLTQIAGDPGVAAARLGQLEGSIDELRSAAVARELVAARTTLLVTPGTPLALIVTVLDEVSRRGAASALVHRDAWLAARATEPPDPSTPAGLRADLVALVLAPRGEADSATSDRVVFALGRFDLRGPNRAVQLTAYRLAMRHVGGDAQLRLVDALSARLATLELGTAREVAQLVALEISLMPPALGAEVLARVAAALPGRIEEILDGAALKWLSARALLAQAPTQGLPVAVRARLALQDGRVREAFALLRENLSTASPSALDQLGRLVVTSCPIGDGGALAVSKEHWLDADAAWDLLGELATQRPDPVLLAHRARLAMRVGAEDAGKHVARALDALLAGPETTGPALPGPRAGLALELLAGTSLDAPKGAMATWSALLARAYGGNAPQPLLGDIGEERRMVLGLMARERSPLLLERLAWLLDRDPNGFELELFERAMEGLARGAAREALDDALGTLAGDSRGNRLIQMELARHGDRPDDERTLLDALLAESPRIPWLWARRIELARRRAGWVELVPELRRALNWIGDEARRDLLVAAVDALYEGGETATATELATEFVRLHPRHALHTSTAPLAAVLRHADTKQFDAVFSVWVEGSKLSDMERRFVELDLALAGGLGQKAYGLLAPLRSRPELAERVNEYERTLSERFGADLPFEHFLATATFPETPDAVRDDIDYQIDQLSSRNFGARDRAEGALRRAGVAAGRALLEGSSDKNPEIRHRCRALLRTLFEAQGGRPLAPKDPNEGD